jgi:hypothetical protein
VKYLFHTHWRKSDFLVQLVDFSPFGFGPFVFWLSCRLVELSFGRVGYVRVVVGRVVSGRVVGGQDDGLPYWRSCCGTMQVGGLVAVLRDVTQY